MCGHASGVNEGDVCSHTDPQSAFATKGDHCERRMYAQFHDGRQPDVKSLALFGTNMLKWGAVLLSTNPY
jgi:hypothetical protein